MTVEATILPSSEEVEDDSLGEDLTPVEFVPPSLPCEDQDPAETYTFYSEIPSEIGTTSTPCILGVDEAGRGPVLGPMVYAVSYCKVDYKQKLAAVGFDDSKVLTHQTRSDLLEKMCTDEELKSNIGWATTIMTARDISSGMLRPDNHGPYNLNEQAHDTTMALIDQVLKRGVNVVEAYVDTVGPPAKYQDKLSKRFPSIKFTVAKKADSLYPIVSAASICAKVTRDASLIAQDTSGGTWGSGYPSDPRTSAWLHEKIDPVFGWQNIVRFSWQTTRDAFEKSRGVEIEWADDHIKTLSKVTAMFGKQDKPTTVTTGLDMSTRWYGANVSSF
ncbi:Rnh201p [Sugiyamaella lignohabitans]|uniref:Ribonuclease n=1 Tax=Sugiyamaella lignohabitans TaxID=796027 RepID=A0A161HNV1_9ASCO|nr:Rnh201p [Sugiyamaella lignohabitans]ANB15887.1 Rnh201p [Sugiyamaella lignohabitans]